MVANTKSSVLERVFNASAGTFEPEVARLFLRLDFTHEDRVRMEELHAKSKAGTLDDHDRFELEQFIEVGDILSLLHLKSRAALNLPLSNGFKSGQ